jgi:hypothetical protein
VNTGEVDGSDSEFSIDIYDGGSGLKIKTVTAMVAAKRWLQVNGILESAPGTAQGTFMCNGALHL